MLSEDKSEQHVQDMPSEEKKQKPLSHRKIDWWLLKDIGILIIPIFLFFVPMEWFNGQHTICLIKNITGHDCWGCGITRAIISVVQLNFKEAYDYNKLIIVVFPLLFYVWVKTLVVVSKQIRNKKKLFQN